MVSFERYQLPALAFLALCTVRLRSSARLSVSESHWRERSARTLGRGAAVSERGSQRTWAVRRAQVVILIMMGRLGDKRLQLRHGARATRLQAQVRVAAAAASLSSVRATRLRGPPTGSRAHAQDIRRSILRS